MSENDKVSKSKSKSGKSSRKVRDKSEKKDKESSSPLTQSVQNLSPDQEKLVDQFVEHAWDNQESELRKLIPQIKEQKLLNALNIRGQSALYSAARNGHSKIIIELLNTHGIDINVTSTPHSGTPLHAAGSNGRVEAVAILLAGGANASLSNTSGLKARDDHGNNEKIKEVYAQFDSEPLLTFLLSWPIVKELNSVQKEIKKDAEAREKQQKKLQTQQTQQQAEPVAGFQLAKKQAEKVHVDYAKLSRQELDESIANAALPKAAYSFVQDTPDTGFLNYFNNPAFSALNAKTMGPLDATTILANDRAVGDSTAANFSQADQQLADKIDALLLKGAKPVESNSKYSSYEDNGVIESFGFNATLFTAGGVYTVEKKVEDANKAMFGLALVDNKKTPRSLPSARVNSPHSARGSARQK